MHIIRRCFSDLLKPDDLNPRQLESYFPPASMALSTAPGTATVQGTSGRSNSLPILHDSQAVEHSHSRKEGTPGRKSIEPAAVLEDLQSAFVLNDRNLEIYVTLPSAEKRLFVDVQEEICVPEERRKQAKRRKTGHREAQAAEMSAKDGRPANRDEMASSASTSKLSGQAKNTGKNAKDATIKNTTVPLGKKDVNAKSVTFSEVKTTKKKNESSSSNAHHTEYATTQAARVDNQPASVATSTLKAAKATTSGRERSLPYSTFEHVKLNVRVRPSGAANKNVQKKGSSGVGIVALPKKVAPPKITDRFPLRILGSATRPTASTALQETFDLSVQGSTEVSAILVLLYTRLKLAHAQTLSGLEMNALRLWHLDEDKLVRLSTGTVASNCITSKSILCYTVGKRRGESHCFVYADPAKVQKVEVDLTLTRVWQGEDCSETLEKSIPPNAPRRQLFKFKQDVAQVKLPEGTDQHRLHLPYQTCFGLSLLGERNELPTPLDLALDQARAEHAQRKKDRERSRARKEERMKEVARLEKHRKRLQKKSKGPNSSSHGEGFVVGQPPAGNLGSTTSQVSETECARLNRTVVSDEEEEEKVTRYHKEAEESWDSESFVDAWWDSHEPLYDECDEDLPFQPDVHRVELEDAVLMATSELYERVPDTKRGDATVAAGTSATGAQANSTQTAASVVPTVQAGIQHVLKALGIPKSSYEPFVQAFAKTAAAYPYVAVKLIDYEDVAFAMDVGARYSPSGEPNTSWEIQDVQQVCLMYKGIWKSEAEEWKRACKDVTSVNWCRSALGKEDIPAPTTPSVANATSGNLASASVTAAGAPPSQAAHPTSAPAQAAGSVPSQSSEDSDAEQQFKIYWERTSHRRQRICSACGDEYCIHSRLSNGCHCGACDDGGCREDDEYFCNYKQAQTNAPDAGTESALHPTASSSTSATTVQSESTTTRESATSIMVPGHRARVIQCIFMEAF